MLPPSNEVWGKVIFLHLFVILFTGGGVPDQVHTPGPGTHPSPRDQVHPHLGPGTPPQDQVHPPGPGTPHPDQGDTVYVQAVRILLECILVTLFFLFTKVMLFENWGNSTGFVKEGSLLLGNFKLQTKFNTSVFLWI